MIPETDEVKRWRHPDNCNCCDEVEVDTQEQEIERLRAVIQNAPHGAECNVSLHEQYGETTVGVACTCWKAAAL